MHQEYANYGIHQISGPYEPIITVTKRSVSDITHGEEIEVRHPEIQGSNAKSALLADNHPGEPLDYHRISQESRTDQTREASVRNHSYSSMGREEKIETKHLSTKKTQAETVLTVNYQSKELNS